MKRIVCLFIAVLFLCSGCNLRISFDTPTPQPTLAPTPTPTPIPTPTPTPTPSPTPVPTPTEDIYLPNLKSAISKINEDFEYASVLTTDILRAYDVAIENHLDLNQAMINFMSYQLDRIKKLQDDKQSIDTSMKALLNPPKEYIDAYNVLLDLYTAYISVFELATDPKGSYISYTAQVNNATNSYSQVYAKIKVILP